MTPDYSKPEHNRRKGDIENEHRFTVLEGKADNNSAGISALRSDLDKFKGVFEMETRLQTEDLKEFMLTVTTPLKTEVAEHGKVITEIQVNFKWVYTAITLIGGGFTWLCGFLFTHHDKVKGMKP